MRRSNEARLFGVLGDPVDHSLSPLMHNAAFAALGLPHLYLRYRVPTPALGDALEEARRLRLGGLNLTLPLKEAALSLLDDLTPEAERIGAVNTILVQGRQPTLVGDNTDARGFLRALAGRVALRGSHAVVIGAGGGARAIGSALVAGGVRRVTIANRTPARAESLAERLAAQGPTELHVVPLPALARGSLLGDTAVVVNTTSVGLGGAPLRIRYASSPRRCLFVDLVYGARPTPFLAGAARARRSILDGTAMLLHQGALALEAWLRRPAPLGVMARALATAGLTLTRLGPTASVHRRRPPMP